MPDATPDWEAAERVARDEQLTRFKRGPQHPPWPDAQEKAWGSGWNAAMSWVKRTALLRMLGGRPPEDHCDHQRQETNADTGRVYCLECNTTIAVLPRKKPKRSQSRRRSLARKRACPTCGVEPGERCKDRRIRDGRFTAMKGVHEARHKAEEANNA